MDPLAPIPTPPAQRWREFRIQALPALTFCGILVCVVILWRQYVLPTNLIGEVESMHASVISTVPGTLKELKVKRFDRVKAGEEIAQITTMDPEVFQASLRAIEADLKLMRARMQLDVERNELSYQSERLRYLMERVDLAVLRVNHKYYEAELARETELFTNNPPLLIFDLTTYETTMRLAYSSQTNIIELENYLADKEKTLPTLVPATKADQAVLEDIQAQEEKLRATQLTISLKAPIDGMVSMVQHWQGEKIVPNMPLVTISAVQATRIIGYVRGPYSDLPKIGDTVQIRRKSFKREVGPGTVLEVSGQLEPITSTLIPQAAGVKVELGLPFAVSIPTELAATLIPGEPVDLILNRR